MSLMGVQESGEMYLETIYILSDRMEKVRAIDVGEYMGYSKPSVSRAVGLLKNDGLICVSDSGAITLTEEGRQQAKQIYERHTTLTEVLVHLGVDEKTAADDACRIEHYISEATFHAIKDYLDNHK